MDASLSRTWVLRSKAEAQSLHVFLKLNAKAAADTGRPLQVTVALYREKRSTEHNAYMWAGLLEPVSEQVYVNGQRFKPEVWHEHFKEMFLPEVNAKGVEKWMYLPNGQRRLAFGTSDLNVGEMAAYLMAAEAYAVDELGVCLPEKRGN